MSGGLPTQRFREVQLLIGAALVMLVTVVVVQLQGVQATTAAAEEEARRGADAAVRLLATLTERDGAAAAVKAVPAGVRLAIISPAGIEVSSGDAGPAEPRWWPWPGESEWSGSGRSVAGPLEHAGIEVVVAYQPIRDGRLLRVAYEVSSAGRLRQWQWLAGALALAVAGGGALVAWLMLGRVLAPYRELLAQASRISRQGEREAEDRYLLATFRDTISRLESSEAALQKRADELAVLAEVLTREAGSGVVVCDTAGTVRAANPVAGTLLGSELEVSKPLPVVLGGEEGKLRIAGKLLDVRRFPLCSPDGQVQGEVIYVGDESEREALERALKEREGMATLGELSAGMAHELRNALATIRGYLRLLPGADEGQRERYLASMENEAGGLAAILDRFLGFAQPRELRLEDVDLSGLTRDVVDRLRPAFSTVEVNVEGVVQRISADRLALSVVLENLLRNAAESLEGRAGSVVVTLEDRGDVAAVTVADDGPGVSEEVRSRLFGPFVSSKPSGGLGLAMARRLARLHGGEVEYSPRPGGGSRFTVTLPKRGAA